MDKAGDNHEKPSSGYRRRLVMDAKDTSVEAEDNDRVH
jgi:hypothetical protein